MLHLHHPHLVRPWGFTLSEGPPGLLVDLYSAGSLASVLAHQGRLSLGQSITATVPIAQALDHLHQRQAAHGDVTTANVLLSAEGSPALADFGDTRLLRLGGEEPDQRQDIRDLAQLIWTAISGSPAAATRRRTPLTTMCPETPTSLALVLEEMLDASSTDLPTAADAASELFAATEAEPLDLWEQAQGEVIEEVPTRIKSPSLPRSRFLRLMSRMKRHRKPTRSMRRGRLSA